MKKADKYILIGVLFILILSTFSVYIFKTYFSRPGAIAVVTQNGVPIHRIDLSLVETPYEIVVPADDGSYNTLAIQNNQIQIIDADCPDKVCIKTGPLSHTGDISVCLPHGLMVEIQEGQPREIDSLSH